MPRLDGEHNVSHNCKRAMQRLANPSIVVPDRFRFTVKETGYTVRSSDYWSWIAKTKAHYKANGITFPPDLVEQMESQLCAQLPPEWCNRPNEAGYVDTRMSWADFANGMRALAGLLTGKYEFVGQVEAERRAYLCAGCPLNVALAGCGSCRRMTTLITGEVAQRRTPYDADLKACAVCKCSVQATVHFPMEALETADTPEKQALFPDFCWRNRQSANYRPNEELAAA